VVYLAVAAVVFVVNLIPAFGPPTWAVLVLFKLNTHVPAVPLVLTGAVAAASGRYTLARGARAVGGRLPARRRARLEHLRDRLVRHRAGALAGLALFAFSPVPSAQLFLAAGLLDVALVPATAAFFAGRLVSYAGYVGAATLVDRSYGDVATDALRSPWGITVQVVFTLAVAALPFVPWPSSDDTADDGSAGGSG
jgi:uncharacterized membrane protein YdjX (TVP38/TMEM64 family)